MIHRESNTLLAEGPVKTGIRSLEGNYYVKNKYLIPGAFKTNYTPGLCTYKFIYVWIDLIINDKKVVKNIGWKYIAPNPIFYPTLMSIGLPKAHPELVFKFSD